MLHPSAEVPVQGAVVYVLTDEEGLILSGGWFCEDAFFAVRRKIGIGYLDAGNTLVKNRE